MRASVFQLLKQVGRDGQARGMNLFLTKTLLSFLASAESFFPSTFQFGGNQSVVRIRALKLPVRQTRLVSQPLDLLAPSGKYAIARTIAFGQDALGRIDFRRRQRFEEPAHDLVIKNVRW